MAKGKRHSDELRAAVTAALLAGQGVNEVAARYQLDSGLVSRWKAKLPASELQQVAAKKGEHLAELIENHLRASLNAAITIANQANDPKWRAGQPASDLAVFYGVLTDKAIRILDAAQLAGEQPGVSGVAGSGQF